MTDKFIFLVIGISLGVLLTILGFLMLGFIMDESTLFIGASNVIPHVQMVTEKQRKEFKEEINNIYNVVAYDLETIKENVEFMKEELEYIQRNVYIIKEKVVYEIN